MKLASELNHHTAQLVYGVTNILNKNGDDKKSILYLFAAAKSNYGLAQYTLGMLYFMGKFVQKNINIGIDYFNQSSLNGFNIGHFVIGYFYQEGKHLPRNMIKAVHYYKNASSFNEPHAKNNLGIIYKYGFGQDIKQSIELAIIYFTEAINKSNDILSIYNLAHIYIFIDKTKEKIIESIDLLLQIINIKDLPVIELLCIAIFSDFSLLTKLDTKLQSKINRKIRHNDLYNRKNLKDFIGTIKMLIIYMILVLCISLLKNIKNILQ